MIRRENLSFRVDESRVILGKNELENDIALEQMKKNRETRANGGMLLLSSEDSGTEAFTNPLDSLFFISNWQNKLAIVDLD
jgi:hypothetical protein